MTQSDTNRVVNEEPFFAWWNGDDMSSRNPYDKGTRLYWAWEGWLAGMDLKEYTEDHVRLLIKEAVEAEREGCAKVAEERFLAQANCTAEEMYELQKKVIAEAIRARGRDD